MIRKIEDFAPEGLEAGVGLVLQDSKGRYIFFLAGKRHHCPPGELFFAGIGGHREVGEDWLECARREALEEVGTEVQIIPSPVTWYIPRHEYVQRVQVSDLPRPLALYEMTHLPATPRAGEIYRIVIYKAQLHGLPKDMPPDEVLGVITLTAGQVIHSLEYKPSLEELLTEGASLVAGGEQIDLRVRIYPLGTARALALILRHTRFQPVKKY